MEHAHHFLTRLDRLSIPHVELALSLYRDHELMKYILDSAKVPEGVERIALSLADPNRGPFLVVTRSGKFVTCLGEGMRKGALPVITREKLDGIATRVEVLRGRMEVARKVTGERGGVGKLFRRLHDAGPRLSREEFTAAAAWQPMLITDFIRWMIDTADDVKKARVILYGSFGDRTNSIQSSRMRLAAITTACGSSATWRRSGRSTAGWRSRIGRRRLFKKCTRCRMRGRPCGKE
ncbi:MAG: hypothetical protein IPM54_08170 [Polyangiaceae bacterium]|nr:hypothetical protein [Polyangiaceae bacterium]